MERGPVGLYYNNNWKELTIESEDLYFQWRIVSAETMRTSLHVILNMSRSYDGQVQCRSGRSGAVQKRQRTAKQSLIKMAACQAAIRLMTRFGLYLQGTKKNIVIYI